MALIILLILSTLSFSFAEIWTVHVYTGTERYSGTDSNVYIKLFNEDNDSTSEIQLTHYNWQPEDTDFLIRNLFETGAHEQFRIQTELMKSITKIQIRHNNFPSFQADWLLEKVIIERNRDGARYIFPCDCWLRARKPYITISALPDERTINKNKNKELTLKNSRAFIVILIILIIIIISIFCCFNIYRHQSISLSVSIEENHQEPYLLNTTEQSSGPQLWIKTKRRWRNFRNRLPSSNHTQTTQNIITTQMTTTSIPSDQPPSYEDLFPPNITTPINSAASSNL